MYSTVFGSCPNTVFIPLLTEDRIREHLRNPFASLKRPFQFVYICACILRRTGQCQSPDFDYVFISLLIDFIEAPDRIMRIPQPPVRTLLFVNIDRQPLQPIIVVVGSSGLDGSDGERDSFSDLYLSSSLSQPAVISPAKSGRASRTMAVNVFHKQKFLNVRVRRNMVMQYR